MGFTTAKIKNDHHEDYTYVFEPQALNAIKAAVLINRPLLVKGKPGSGKSQLAKAAASYLNRAYLSHVVSAKTEAQNLLWSFDGVARLADAQIEGALCDDPKEKSGIREKLALKNYIKPEALWAALNWSSAEEQFKVIAKRQEQDLESFTSPLAGCLNAEQALTNGVVVLIDEIDKADSSLPNGLLEVLGSNRFQPDGLDSPVELNCAAKAENTEADTASPKPLIIITSNDEHPLPDAFIRRCLVVEVGMPDVGKSQDKQRSYLVEHAKPNFKKLAKLTVTNDKDEQQSVLEAVADQVISDRKNAHANNIKPLIGQAEYFDLLRGLDALVAQQGEQCIEKWIKALACFSSQKGMNKDAKAEQQIDLPAMSKASDAN